jgi:hypothetical protein
LSKQSDLSVDVSNFLKEFDWTTDLNTHPATHAQVDLEEIELLRQEEREAFTHSLSQQRLESASAFIPLEQVREVRDTHIV